MQKLILLVAIVLANLTAFSQTVTKNSTDTVIILPKNVAREVVKDVIRKDSLESEINIHKKNEVLLKSNLVAKDSIIASKDTIINIWSAKEKNYLSIIDTKDQQKTNLEALTKSLSADLRKAKRKSTIKTIIGGAAIGLLLYLYIAK